MKKEIWKSIPEYSFYEASTLGRIRSIDRIVHFNKMNKTCVRFYREKILSPGKSTCGYLQVGIYKNTAKKYLTPPIHRLIALTFLGPKPKGLQVAHLNGIKTDNRLENLKWVTAKENQSHKRLHGTHVMGEENPHSKLKTKDVLEIRKLRKKGVSRIEIAKKYGICSWQIWHITSKRSWAHVA